MNCNCKIPEPVVQNDRDRLYRIRFLTISRRLYHGMSRPVDFVGNELKTDDWYGCCLRRMQDPACDIDLLSQYTRRSKELLEICRQRLTATDNEIKALLANIEQEQPNP